MKHFYERYGGRDLTETRILPLHPWPFPPDMLNAVRTVKAEMNLPLLVKPQPARSGARILATAVPDFVAEYALVRSTTSDLEWALKWVLGITEHDTRASDFSDWLALQFDAPVVELAPEPVEQRVSFR